MVQIVSEFFGIVGVSQTPPDNLAELIPYLLQIIVAVVMVVAVIRLVSYIAQIFCNWRWFR